MIDETGRVRRLLVLAAAAVALVAVSGGSVVLAGNNGTKPSSSDVAATTAPVAATTAPAAGQSNPFDAAVQALVEDGTINQAQAGALRRQIEAGTIDPLELVATGVLTAAQMQAVETRLGAVKQSLGAAAGGTSSSASSSTSKTALKEAADAAVQALVEDGTINQHQADVLRQQIDAGYMDEQELVDGGVLTAAQMQAVLNRLLAVKESFASGAGGTPSSASKISKDPSKTK
jgi:polyhydroxyalkanoate synthesis regulator phasin